MKRTHSPRRLRGLALAALFWAVSVLPARAWPPALEQALFRDAQRLLPAPLARLLQAREETVLEAARSLDLESLTGELQAGRLEPHTLSAADAQMGQAVALMQQRRVGAGLVQLGALLRIAADVSDPALAASQGQLPPEVMSEYYAFIEANLDKIPVVLDDPHALRLRREELGDYWQSLLTRSRDDAGVIRTELFWGGRVVRHQTLDYHSPVFGVGSLAYSRAVTGIAATWLAGWRTVRGDLSGVREPHTLTPGTSTAAAPDTASSPRSPTRNP